MTEPDDQDEHDVPEPPRPPEAPGHPLTAADAWALVPKEVG